MWLVFVWLVFVRLVFVWLVLVYGVCCYAVDCYVVSKETDQGGEWFRQVINKYQEYAWAKD